MSDSNDLSVKLDKSGLNNLNDATKQIEKLSERRTSNRLESEESLGLLSDSLLNEETFCANYTDFSQIYDKYIDKNIYKTDSTGTVFLPSDSKASIVDGICLATKEIDSSLTDHMITEYSSTSKQLETVTENVQLAPFVSDIHEIDDSVIIEPSLGKFEVDNIEAGDFSPSLASTHKILPCASLKVLSETFRSVSNNISEILSPIQEKNALNSTRVFASNCDEKESNLDLSTKNESPLNKTFEVPSPIDHTVPSQATNNDFNSSTNFDVSLNNTNGEIQNLNNTFVLPIPEFKNPPLGNTYKVPLNKVFSGKTKMHSNDYENVLYIEKDKTGTKTLEINGPTSLKSSGMKFKNVIKRQHSSVKNVQLLKNCKSKSIDVQTTIATNFSKVGFFESNRFSDKNLENRMSFPLTKQEFKNNPALNVTFCVKEKVKAVTSNQYLPVASIKKSCVEKSGTHLKFPKTLASLKNSSSNHALKKINSKFGAEPKYSKSKNLNLDANVNRILKPELSSTGPSSSNKTEVEKSSSKFPKKNECNGNATKVISVEKVVQAPFITMNVTSVNSPTMEFLNVENCTKAEFSKSFSGSGSSKESNGISNHSYSHYSKPLKHEIKLNDFGSRVLNKTYNEWKLPKAIVKSLGFDSKDSAAGFKSKLDKNLGKNVDNKRTLKEVQGASCKISSTNFPKKKAKACSNQSEPSENPKKELSTLPMSSTATERRRTCSRAGVIKQKQVHVPEPSMSRKSIANVPKENKFTNQPNGEVKETPGTPKLKSKLPVLKFNSKSSFKRNRQ